MPKQMPKQMPNQMFTSEEIARTGLIIKRNSQIKKYEDEFYEKRQNQIYLFQTVLRNPNSKFNFQEYEKTMSMLEGMKYFIPRSDWLIYLSSTQTHGNQKIEELIVNKDIQRYIADYL